MSVPSHYPRIPYGEADFRRIRLNGWLYVDKTGIRDYIDGERVVQTFLAAHFALTDHYVLHSEWELSKGGGRAAKPLPSGRQHRTPCRKARWHRTGFSRLGTCFPRGRGELVGDTCDETTGQVNAHRPVSESTLFDWVETLETVPTPAAGPLRRTRRQGNGGL